ncbi:MAG: MBL fold metallo-hydrolase [Ruminococcaceae bacterium]|nr:MBL fold metallo-hydrolase [Oscillospiraceae bacterium]
MASCEFYTLFSGSSGNSVFIRHGEDAILVDAGKNAKAVEGALAALGSGLRAVKAIFVTHEHSDHVAALPVISRRYGIPIHLLSETALEMKELPESAVLHEGLFTEQVGSIRVDAFYTPHDSARSVGYVVSCGCHRFGIATDMGVITKNVVEALAGCDCAMIESNYDEEMLANGPYPACLKARIASSRGHLSNKNGALLAAILAHAGTERIVLGHLSAENNDPEIALRAAAEELCRRGLCAELAVADRHHPTCIFAEKNT